MENTRSMAAYSPNMTPMTDSSTLRLEAYCGKDRDQEAVDHHVHEDDEHDHHQDRVRRRGDALTQTPQFTGSQRLILLASSSTGF